MRNYSYYFKHKDTKKQSIVAFGRYNEQQSCLQSPQSLPLQAFVATFKSLVVFVSKYNLRFFVSLCSNI